MSNTGLRLWGFAALACALSALPALADSQARIVRLSDVQGAVMINKNTGMGFERAFLNLPVTQGTQLQTRATGRAEIEFEDGSTMLLAPNSRLSFTTLSLNNSGTRVTVMNLDQGMAYVNWVGKGADNLTANFSKEKIQLSNPAHLRIETSPAVTKVAVFKGDVDVNDPSGDVNVEKKKMAIFGDSPDGKYKLAKVEEEPLDNWDKESVEYHSQYARNTTASPYDYGLSDLNYYGSYSNIAGYGMMWQPFFTGMGWDPFMDGAYSFYPGMGYMFVSAYPWGWMPYLYGNWMFVPSRGWMWQAGNWNNYAMVPRYAATNASSFHPPVAPTGTTQTVVFGHGGPAATALMTNQVGYRIGRGSAGFGIPRGSLDKWSMSHLSSQVSKSGSAIIQPVPRFANTSTGRNEMMMSRGYGPGRAGAYGARGAYAGARGEAAGGGRFGGAPMGGEAHAGGGAPAAAAGGGHH